MYQDKAGEFRFRLNARNGKSILASEGYSFKGNYLKEIESIRKNAFEATIEEE
ncbi:MAG: YegP family protein [Gudongella sp.]|nr:YegP family protein [Gudongella sp.]